LLPVDRLAMLLVRRRAATTEASVEDRAAIRAAIARETQELVASPTPVITRLTRVGFDALSVQLFGLAALPELHPMAARAVTRTVELTRVTVECATQLFPDEELAVQERLRPAGRLRSSGLIALEPPVDSVPWPARQLKCPERVVQFLLGVQPELPAEARGVARFRAGDTDAPAGERIAAAIFDEDRVLWFPAGDATAAVLVDSARRRSRRLLAVDVPRLLAAERFDALLPLLGQEMIFGDHLIVFEHVDGCELDDDRWPALSRQLLRLGSAFALVGGSLPPSIERELDVERGVALLG
jgi:hypothetical protein